MSLAVRTGLHTYALLLRLMPKRYRADFGRESMADLREILLEAECFQGETVVGNAECIADSFPGFMELMQSLESAW